jgi:tRNA threonylcarbamoyladenosine biosynthesis protein TsaB
VQRFLAIETSSEACSVALDVGGEVLQRHAHAPLRHAELVLPAVHGLLDESGCGLAALDAIVFGRGPGSFTSLRIGIGVVQGLAWGADLPVIPISSLAVVAQRYADSQADAHLRCVMVAMDARMGEVFHCAYALGAARRLSPCGRESVSDPAAVTVSEPEWTAGVGTGFARYAQLQRLGAGLAAVSADLTPCAAALMPLARQWLERHQPLSAEHAQPVYVRNEVADKPPPNPSGQTGIN